MYSFQSPGPLSVKLYRGRGSALSSQLATLMQNISSGKFDGNNLIPSGGWLVGQDISVILTDLEWCVLLRFLREELSSTQLDLIKSRSEVKVLLEELTACKTDNLEAEQFPNLLLSSLDKLFEDKQQQLWLVCDNGTATTIYSLLLFIRRLNNYTFSPT